MCPNLRYKGEMLELVRDIIKTKQGAFHLARFDGRYEKALARIVKAKRERKTIGAPKRPQPSRVVDELRASGGMDAGKIAAKAKSRNDAPSRTSRAPANAASPRRKAG